MDSQVPEAEELAKEIHARCHEGRWFRRAKELEQERDEARRVAIEAGGHWASALRREVALGEALEKARGLIEDYCNHSTGCHYEPPPGRGFICIADCGLYEREKDFIATCAALRPPSRDEEGK